MKNIIVSGGAGFVGSHLVDRLLARQDIEKLIVVDNLWTGEINNLAHISDPRLKIEIQDIETFRSDIRFDEVYHLASPASPQHYSSKPDKTISANIIGAMRLKELMKPNGKFCFTSSSEVYGDPKISPQPESYLGSVDCTGPRASYDEGKRCTEAFLFECQRVYGMDVRVVRPFNIYGPRTKPDDGRCVSNFVTQALSGEPITIYGTGEQTRSWGYIDDIMDGFERFFWLDNVSYKGPLNIGNNREISVLEVAQYIANLIPETKTVHLPPVPHDPTNRCPDLTLSNKILPGWSCDTKYELGILKTMEWFTKNLKNDGNITPLPYNTAKISQLQEYA